MTCGPAVVRPARSRSASNCVGLVGDEVAALPVAVEHRAELVDHVRVAGRRDADVPLESGHLGRVREIRRADVGRREPRATMEHPRLRVQPRRAEVVRDPDLGAEVDELVERSPLGRVGVRRRQHAQRSVRRHSAGAALRAAVAIPLRRMNAITTSIASAESISDRNWLHSVGSPGALVSNVVSSSGISGTSRSAGVPSGPAPQDRVQASLPDRWAERSDPSRQAHRGGRAVLGRLGVRPRHVARRSRRAAPVRPAGSRATRSGPRHQRYVATARRPEASQPVRASWARKPSVMSSSYSPGSSSAT